DWGGAFQNNTEITGKNENKVTQGNSLSFWGNLDINNYFNLKGAAGYRYLYDSGEIFHIPEFNLFMAYGGTDIWSYRAGRFTLGDKNNNLFGALIDGIGFDLNSEIFSVSTGVGFTGFTFNRNSSVIMSGADHDANADEALMASPRIAQYAEASFYVLPGDGVLSAAVLAQQDLRSSNILD
ncbi:MAG: hypothetical protein GY786_25135, partial [Proteobacteria bacterium]|nr:hypothetical protein [Pseudomonadota bacterium]